MLKKHLTSLKKIEKVVFFIRRMQKVGQKGWGSKIWQEPIVRALLRETQLLENSMKDFAK